MQEIPKIYAAINSISNKLAAPKDKTCGFGKYKYRDLPSLRNGLKPLLSEYGVFILPSASKAMDGNKDVLTMTMRCISTEDGSEIQPVPQIMINCDDHKGMSAEQASGSALTYAEKYLLCMIFHVDDDSDATDPDSDSVQTKDKEAYSRELKKAIDDIRTAHSSDELTTIMGRYKQFWKDPQFIKEGTSLRAQM